MSLLKKPCKECPFRRKSAPGYLGAASYQPGAFLTPIEWRDEHAACHMAVDWEQDEDNIELAIEDAPTCYEYAVYMKNQAKLPRNLIDASATQAVDVDHDNIFSNMREFVEHHKNFNNE